MNRIVFISIGLMLVMLGALMGVPAIVDASLGNPDWKVFAISSGVSLFIGGALVLANRGSDYKLGLREGYLLTVGSWVAISLMAAVPFWISSLNISFTDSVFEAVSGLTTTGSTVLSGLDSMPPGLLLWRGLLQWIGGIGIVVMAVAMLPFLRVGGMQLFRLESSDRSDKVAPRLVGVSIRIVGIYIGLTVLCVGAYWAFGMTVFESIVHAMTTVSTGGFSTSDQSLGYFASPSIEWTAVVFMLASGLPFAVYVKFLGRFDWSVFTKDSQVKTFLGYTAFFIAVFGLWLVFEQRIPLDEAFRKSAFSVVSIVTTTGYASGDYLQWGVFAATLFFMLTFIGGCAGSTAGGIKTFRFQVMAVEIVRQSKFLIHPNGVFKARLGGRPIERELSVSVFIFFTVMVIGVAAITVALAFMGLDFTTSISAAVTALANVGPGLGGVIGPAGNFESLSDGAKWILDIGMLAGRLEFFTVLVLFIPGYWKESGFGV